MVKGNRGNMRYKEITKHDVRITLKSGRIVRKTLSDENFIRYQKMAAHGATKAQLAKFARLHSTAAVSNMYKSTINKAIATTLESKIGDKEALQKWRKLTGELNAAETEKLGRALIDKFRVAREQIYEMDMEKENQVTEASALMDEIYNYANEFIQDTKKAKKTYQKVKTKTPTGKTKTSMTIKSDKLVKRSIFGSGKK